ncbi:MAG: transcriptional regulator, family [Clostridiaceae bacterium]|jgi:transcriptional regulator with XRE-family HTH domain|nr:transcriptional regulator, family [Clostridiaceae bacterium]
MSRIGEKIKLERLNAKLTQKALGKKLGVSESFVNEVEAGRKIINQSLIDRISKVLGADLNDVTMSFEEQVYEKEKDLKYDKKPKKEDVKEVWNEAFGSVIKNVPIYKYELDKSIDFKQMPLVSNKIEGFAQDKVIYLEIQEDDMIGFRLSKGDLALAHLTSDIENNSICLIEVDNERFIRQIRKLDNNKLLLISNRGTTRTETVDNKSIKVIAKLLRVEIKL